MLCDSVLWMLFIFCKGLFCYIVISGDFWLFCLVFLLLECSNISGSSNVAFELAIGELGQCCCACVFKSSAGEM